jgi:hypothetical protein
VNLFSKKEDDAMAQPMSPSEMMTTGQIGKAQELIGAGLRKANLPSELVQKVLETQGDQIVAEFVASFRRRVGAISGTITRRVKADPNRTPQEVLDAAGREQYTDDEVVRNMPKSSGEEIDVHFFKVGRWISDDDLEKEYDQRGLKPVDSYSLAKVNEDDSAFTDEHPNGTHWKNADGKWCFAIFDRWDGEREVYVYRDDRDWDGGWWFAGVSQ